MCPMTSGSFEDADLLLAMRAYVSASAAVESAADDSQLIALSEAKSMAGMLVRKRLMELGWSAPERQRSST